MAIYEYWFLHDIIFHAPYVVQNSDSYKEEFTFSLEFDKKKVFQNLW